jgi:hypothetical protein
MSLSALVATIVPDDVEQEKLKHDIDEFGFVRAKEKIPVISMVKSRDECAAIIEIAQEEAYDGPTTSATRSNRVLDEIRHKKKWLTYLNLTYNQASDMPFSWDQVTSLNRCENLRSMIRGQGVPHSLRPLVWMRLTGALHKKLSSKFKYGDLFKNIQHDQYNAAKQIEKDLLRTLPNNVCFSSMKKIGIQRLRRVLQSLSWLYPSIGYCQGMGTVAASLLLFLDEEDSFWMMSTIIEDILPAAYYSHTLLGLQADMRVLRQLIGKHLPMIDEKFKLHDIELSLVCVNWFLTIFSNVFPMKILLRVWDLFFYEGSAGIFQITLAMLKLNEPALAEATSSSQIFAILTDIPAEINDVDLLIETSIRIGSSINKNNLDVSRRKHQAYLIAQNGSSSLVNHQNLLLATERAQFPNRDDKSRNIFKIIKKTIKNGFKDLNNNHLVEAAAAPALTSSRKSFSSEEGVEDVSDVKMKNIVQTELLVNLREIIIKIAHHFQSIDPAKYSECDLNADYSVESHSRDYERYAETSKVRASKRAKAVLDFDKTDNDELGFKKNQIITILSTKDDHCWIGELNGQKGWFPSRFVSIIDERNGKIYSSAGDDSVNESIRDLVRGELCLALKAIFEHGLKKWTLLGGSFHPWTFIEEVAKKVVEKDFESVYSRLVLCKTFRLEEDSNVLTPDELLFRSVKLINLSHNMFRASMDVKLRSLICIALNEQVLHIWLETLCSCLEMVEKWYQEWSFLRSPGWVQIKCELRLLAQFSFLLNSNGELPDVKNDFVFEDCIKDMLIKHHLFSWEI